MGLSFHYSGKIGKPELLSDLIDEIKDIANVYKWKYTVYERQFPENTIEKKDYNNNIYGIHFTPTDCETISICFLSNGRMSDKEHLMFFGKTDTREESEYLYMLSVKTQYAGAELHKFIINLFRYLSKKYFADFKMSDESKYWETNDEVLLKSNFEKYTNLINGFTTAIEIYPMNTGENIETYFARLIKKINDKKNM